MVRKTKTTKTASTPTVKKTQTKKATRKKKFNTKKIKIGITLGLKDNKESIWTNGIKQNVLMLIHMLKNSTKEYEVHLLNTLKADFSTKPSYLNDIDVHYFEDKYLDMDMLIVMGAQVHNHQLEKFKESGEHKKTIAYKCGNNYVITMENVLFGDNSDKKHQFNEKYDELWYIPQQDEANRGYYHTLYRTNSIIVPFIWHQKFLLESIIGIEDGFKKGSYKKSWQYEIGKEKKVLGVMSQI